jgi:hypothetical protein
VGLPYLRAPIAEIAIAANYLDEAVSAHMSNLNGQAEDLIRRADMASVRDWAESLLCGRSSPYVHYRRVPDSPAKLERAQRMQFRMPTAEERRTLHLRDGYHCRFCGIPVIRKEIRERLRKLYPRLSLWGRTNPECHATLLATWAQYDHILPHSRGGDNDLRNIVVTCAPCNFGRMSRTLEEVGLADPRTREPVVSDWDGLERLLR